MSWWTTEQMVRIDCWPGADWFVYWPMTPLAAWCLFGSALCFASAFAVSRMPSISLWD